jgi:hypothetical protein
MIPTVFVRLNRILVFRDPQAIYSNQTSVIHPSAATWLYDLYRQGFRIVIYTAMKRKNAIETLRRVIRSLPFKNSIGLISAENLFPEDGHLLDYQMASQPDARSIAKTALGGIPVDPTNTYFVDREQLEHVNDVGQMILLPEFSINTVPVLPALRKKTYSAATATSG